MSIFKDEVQVKRVIFNLEMDLALRLEQAKDDSRHFGKKLDVDAAMNKALDKFLKKAEKKIQEMKDKELRISSKSEEKGEDNKDEGNGGKETLVEKVETAATEKVDDVVDAADDSMQEAAAEVF